MPAVRAGAGFKAACPSSVIGVGALCGSLPGLAGVPWLAATRRTSSAKPARRPSRPYRSHLTLGLLVSRRATPSRVHGQATRGCACRGALGERGAAGHRPGCPVVRRSPRCPRDRLLPLARPRGASLGLTACRLEGIPGRLRLPSGLRLAQADFQGHRAGGRRAGFPQDRVTSASSRYCPLEREHSSTRCFT